MSVGPDSHRQAGSANKPVRSRNASSARCLSRTFRRPPMHGGRAGWAVPANPDAPSAGPCRLPARPLFTSCRVKASVFDFNCRRRTCLWGKHDGVSGAWGPASAPSPQGPEQEAAGKHRGGGGWDLSDRYSTQGWSACAVVSLMM